MGAKPYGEPERRRSLRVTYPPNKRPIFKVDESEFEIADISEMGFRFYHESSGGFENILQGTLTLLCGESIHVKGMIVRETPVYIYMNVQVPIPKPILIKEQQFIQ